MTEAEIGAAALQYVRKVSGQAKPSRSSEAAFALAVEEIAAATGKLLASLPPGGAPKDREVEARKARARSAARFERVA